MNPRTRRDFAHASLFCFGQIACWSAFLDKTFFYMQLDKWELTMCDFLCLSLHSEDRPALEGVDFAHHFDQLGQRWLRQHGWDAAGPGWLLGAVLVLPP